MKYIVMVTIDFGIDDTYEAEYTGEEYTSYEEARKEFLKAKNDVNVNCAYIKTID